MHYQFCLSFETFLKILAKCLSRHVICGRDRQQLVVRADFELGLGILHRGKGFEFKISAPHLA